MTRHHLFRLKKRKSAKNIDRGSFIFNATGEFKCAGVLN